MQQKVYIAGKVTGLEPCEVKRKFTRAQKEIEAQGLHAVNPVEIVGDFNTPWNIAMRKCIKALMDCDAVLLLPDWMDSKGAALEERIASSIGINTFSGTRDLAKRIKLHSHDR